MRTSYMSFALIAHPLMNLSSECYRYAGSKFAVDTAGASKEEDLPTGQTFLAENRRYSR